MHPFVRRVACAPLSRTPEVPDSTRRDDLLYATRKCLGAVPRLPAAKFAALRQHDFAQAERTQTRDRAGCWGNGAITANRRVEAPAGARDAKSLLCSMISRPLCGAHSDAPVD